MAAQLHPSGAFGPIDPQPQSPPTVIGSLTRDSRGGYLVRISCPFCRKTHTHGSPTENVGHRLSHCADARLGSGYTIVALDGGVQ